eukprot:4845815-Pyramimonas_sp.AAC.1
MALAHSLVPAGGFLSLRSHLGPERCKQNRVNYVAPVRDPPPISATVPLGTEWASPQVLCVVP